MDEPVDSWDFFVGPCSPFFEKSCLYWYFCTITTFFFVGFLTNFRFGTVGGWQCNTSRLLLPCTLSLVALELPYAPQFPHALNESLPKGGRLWDTSLCGPTHAAPDHQAHSGQPRLKSDLSANAISAHLFATPCQPRKHVMHRPATNLPNF